MGLLTNLGDVCCHCDDCLVLEYVWSIVHCATNSLLWRNGRRSGLYRDILDISNALQATFGHDTCAYSNDELTKEVGKMNDEPRGV